MFSNSSFFFVFIVSFLIHSFNELYYVIWHEHFLGKIGCKITASAYTWYFSGTTLLMVFSSWERYYHAMLLREPMKKWKMKIVVVLVYAYIIALTVLTLIGTEFTEPNICMYEIYFFGYFTRLTKLFHLITGFAIPALVLGIVFFKIHKFLKADAEKYKTASQQVSPRKRVDATKGAQR